MMGAVRSSCSTPSLHPTLPVVPEAHLKTHTQCLSTLVGAGMLSRWCLRGGGCLFPPSAVFLYLPF